MTIKSTEVSSELKKRGERLFPEKTDRLYWVLCELRRNYIKCIDKYLEKNTAVVADYGCGGMPYKSLFDNKNIVYRGYDFAGNDLATDILDNEGVLPIGSESVDYVMSSQVLEHVTDVNFYLKEAARVLKHGGQLFLSTHGVWQYHPDPTDYWRWTRDGLVKTICEAGFRIDEVIGVVGPAATGIQIFQDAISAKIPRVTTKIFYFVCQQIMQFCDQRCSKEIKDKDACVFICIATVIK
jgi:SAM-dependent methyltransferase